eukprot:SAG22_NODE_4435_length_1270_cov_1.270709_1_plen_292_part_10
MFAVGEYTEANLLYEECIAGRRATLGAGHAETLETIDALAKVHMTLAGQTNFVTLDPKAVGVQRHREDTAQQAYNRKQHYDKARSLFEEAVAGRQQALGHDHTQTLHSCCGLGIVYLACDKNPGRGMALLRDAAAGAEKVLAELRAAEVAGMGCGGGLHPDEKRPAARMLVAIEATGLNTGPVADQLRFMCFGAPNAAAGAGAGGTEQWPQPKRSTPREDLYEAVSAGNSDRLLQMRQMATTLAWAGLTRPDKDGCSPVHWAVEADQAAVLAVLKACCGGGRAVLQGVGGRF